MRLLPAMRHPCIRFANYFINIPSLVYMTGGHLLKEISDSPCGHVEWGYNSPYIRVCIKHGSHEGRAWAGYTTNKDEWHVSIIGIYLPVFSHDVSLKHTVSSRLITENITFTFTTNNNLTFHIFPTSLDNVSDIRQSLVTDRLQLIKFKFLWSK